MGLFQSDLIRSFAVGFALGAIGLFAVMGNDGEDMSHAVVAQAIAAPADGTMAAPAAPIPGN